MIITSWVLRKEQLGKQSLFCSQMEQVCGKFG